MTQLRQPPFTAELTQRSGLLTERWHAWFSLVRRYLRAEMVTAAIAAEVSVAQGANQLVTVSVTDAAQGDVALASLDAVVPTGILLSAHASSGSVAVTIRNESGAPYAPGTITVRATAWRH